ncbi:adenylate/guanylate cyclase domain-containing protein [Rhizobium mongolense]
MKEISPAQNWLLLTAVMAASGVAYSLVVYPDEPVIIGAVFAVFIGMPILAFERRALLRPLYRRLQKLPTAAFIISALLIYEALMNIGYALAASLLSAVGLIKPESLLNILVMPFNVFMYALGVCAVVIFVLRVRELLGRDVFLSMFSGRYRTPVQEERIFLFIDLVDSTPFAEKHGDLRAQQLLNSLFAAFAEPVRRNKGAIDDYVGDSAIITWPLARGLKDGRCVRCIFDILNDIEADAESWLKQYGQVPRLRAALHGGFVITAEIGVDHHKITYFGDTVNTTSRLESLCKTLNRPVLISSELAQRLTLPERISAQDLGVHALKGRGQGLGVMTLAQALPTSAASPKLHSTFN